MSTVQSESDSFYHPDTPFNRDCVAVSYRAVKYKQIWRQRAHIMKRGMEKIVKILKKKLHNDEIKVILGYYTCKISIANPSERAEMCLDIQDSKLNEFCNKRVKTCFDSTCNTIIYNPCPSIVLFVTIIFVIIFTNP